jgi:hypothetical protein
MDDQFLLGLIAGEGCFTINLTQKNTSPGIRVNCKFQLTMGEADSGLVEAIHEYIGVGGVYGEQDIHENWQDNVSIHVSSKDDAKKIRTLIEESATEVFKQSKKWSQFQIWCDVMDLSEGEISPEEAKEIISLKHKIAQVNGAKRHNGLGEDAWMDRVMDE